MASFSLAFLSFSLLVLSFSAISALALHVGVQPDAALSHTSKCSRTCESEFCTVPPFLRYGKYCGLLYGGCPGEEPCDGLDACCKEHDACIDAKNNEYLSQECTHNFLNCLALFKRSGERTFAGNKCSVDEVTNVITIVMDAALLAGKYLHKP